MRQAWMAAAVAMAAGLAALPKLAGAASFCTAGVNDDRLRPLPFALAGEARQVFRLHHEAADDVAHGTVVRCMDGRLLACNAGANLPCGKADTEASLPAGALWCRSNPEAPFIPAYISGHGSIYHWRCRNGAAVTIGEAEPIDAQGYIARYWKALPQ